MIFYFRRPPQITERDHPRSQETTSHTPQPASTQSPPPPPPPPAAEAVNSDQ